MFLNFQMTSKGKYVNSVEARIAFSWQSSVFDNLCLVLPQSSHHLCLARPNSQFRCHNEFIQFLATTVPMAILCVFQVPVTLSWQPIVSKPWHTKPEEVEWVEYKICWVISFQRCIHVILEKFNKSLNESQYVYIASPWTSWLRGFVHNCPNLCLFCKNNLPTGATFQCQQHFSTLRNFYVTLPNFKDYFEQLWSWPMFCQTSKLRDFRTFNRTNCVELFSHGCRLVRWEVRCKNGRVTTFISLFSKAWHNVFSDNVFRFAGVSFYPQNSKSQF